MVDVCSHSLGIISKDASGNSVSVKINVEVIDNGNLTYEGKEIYIKNSAGNYQIARYSDYENYEVFYVQSGAEYKYTGWNTVDGKTKYFTAVCGNVYIVKNFITIRLNLMVSSDVLAVP